MQVTVDAQASCQYLQEVPSSGRLVGWLGLPAQPFGVSPGRYRPVSPVSLGLALPAPSLSQMTWLRALRQA